MITIIPTLEIMKTNIDIILEGSIFERIDSKLNQDHKIFFNSGLFRIDNSVKGVVGFNTTKAICWVAESESKSRKVIILTENTQDYKQICNGKIVAVSPSTFIDRVERAKNNYQNRLMSNLDDSLNALFFI